MYHFTVTKMNPSSNFGFLPKSWSFVLLHNLVCLFWDTFSSKKPDALCMRHALEALLLYGHFSTALKALTVDGCLFAVHLLFSLWHCAFQQFSCCFFLLSHHGKGDFFFFFNCLPLMLKLGKVPCFLWEKAFTLSFHSLLSSIVILSSLLINLNLQDCI